MAKPMRQAVRPVRTLLFLLLAVIAIFATVGVGSVRSDASFTPNLALDLEGGTQLILTPRTENDEVVTADDINQAIAVIRQRVDGSGVAEAEITSQGGRNIVVALPGDPPQETIDLVSQSAQMRMRPVLMESFPGPIDAAAVLPELEAAAAVEEDTENEDTENEDTDGEGAEESGEDPSAEATTPAPATQEEIERAAFLAADFDGDGVISDTPLADPASASDTAWITEAVMQEFYLLDCASPENLIGGGGDDPDAPLVACSNDGSTKYVVGPAELEGSHIDSATSGYRVTATGVTTNEPVVQLQFTRAGGELFADVTSRLASLVVQPPMNQFAIVLDGLVISAPGVEETIAGGQATISGSSTNPFTRQEANTLANQLNFGSLPLTFDLQSQEQISATLGVEQLQRGMLAGAIGLVLVALFTLWQYRGLALVTVSSLIVAAILTYASLLVLSWLQGYRLSLAGVAGLIVAIGITADSFILYFERIRDEVREGRTLKSAVEHGWKRARRTILASDAINFLAAVVLYYLAVGGVRGFAFTLGLTTLIDLVVVMAFTYPMVQLLVRTKFFGNGHPWSGLDPVSLGASAASYVGRGRVRTRPEREAILARAQGSTIAERRAAAARAEAEAAKTEAADPSAAEPVLIEGEGGKN